MKSIRSILELVVATGLLLSSIGGQAQQMFFQDGFEAESTSSSSPKWSWKPSSMGDDEEFGMMLGTGDIYERSSAQKHSGSYSLRLNFDGRNGYCNTCGVDTFFVANGISQSVYFRDQGGSTMSMLPDARRPVFNKSDKWSRWSSVLVDAGTVTFAENKPTRRELGGAGYFNAGDEVKVARACGVDGTVGGNISRRSDCNLAINYMQGIDDGDFPYGGRLARRMYLYIPATTVMPNIGIKLGYSTFKLPDGSMHNVIPLIEVQRNEEFEIKTTSLTGKYTFTKIKVARDQWWYLEEVFQRESAAGSHDGTYTAYFASAGDENPAPVAQYSGVEYGALREMSVIGNWQHTNDAKGYIYVDDVAIGAGRIGPADGVSVGDTAPPNAPHLEVQ